MSNLDKNQRTGVVLPEGHILTVTPLANGAGAIYEVGAYSGALKTITSTPVTMGPYNIPTKFEVACSNGQLSVTTASAGTPANLTTPSAPFISLGTQSDSAGVPTGVVVDEYGNALSALIANVSNQTNTLAYLLAQPGGNGQIAKATDADALVVFNGVAAQAKPYYRSRLVGKTTIHAGQAVAAGAANVWTTIDFATAGLVIEDDLGAASLAGNSIIVPANIDYYEVIYSVTWTEITGTSGVKRWSKVTNPTINNQVNAAPNLTAGARVIAVGMAYKNLTLGVAKTITMQTQHDSAAIPDLGFPGTLFPWMTVLMYRN